MVVLCLYDDVCTVVVCIWLCCVCMMMFVQCRMMYVRWCVYSCVVSVG